jgi:hypothetical protein
MFFAHYTYYSDRAAVGFHLYRTTSAPILVSCYICVLHDESSSGVYQLENSHLPSHLVSIQDWWSIQLPGDSEENSLAIESSPSSELLD